MHCGTMVFPRGFPLTVTGSLGIYTRFPLGPYHAALKKQIKELYDEG